MFALSASHIYSILFGTFLSFFLCATPAYAEECKSDGAELAIAAELNKDFVLTSFQYPKAVNQSCLVRITAAQNVSIYIQYIHAFYVGDITYTIGNESSKSDSLDTANYGPYKTFILQQNNNLTIDFAAPNNGEQLWMGFEAVVSVSSITNDECSLGGSGNAAINLEHMRTQNRTALLFPDYYKENATRNNDKNCSWTIAAPPAGNVLSFRRLGISIHDNEELTITGKRNGTDISLSFNGTEFNLRYAETFDEAVTVKYVRENGAQSNDSTLAFQILFELMPTGTAKNCSLEYHNQLYDGTNRNFSNIVPYHLYPKNEKCSWQIQIPANNTFTLEYRNDYYGKVTGLSGDKLLIEAPHEPLYSSTGDKRYFAEIAPKPEPYNATLIWETDGLFEYNGFALAVELNPEEGSGSSILPATCLLAILLILSTMA